MAVAHDAATITTAYTASGQSKDHTPVGTPAAVLALVAGGDGTDNVTSVTYGGEALSFVAVGVDTANETMDMSAWFLGSGVPTGTQGLIVNYSGSNKRVGIITVTAATNCEIVDFEALGQNQANPQVTLDSGTVEALRYVGIRSGLANVTDLTVLADMSALGSVDFGTQVARWDRETAASTGTFTIGYTAASDDVAFVAVAIAEVAAPGGTTWPGFVSPFGW